MSKKQDWKTKLFKNTGGFDGCCGIDIFYNLRVVVRREVAPLRGEYYPTTEEVNFDPKKHYLSAAEIKELKKEFNEYKTDGLAMLLASTIPSQKDVVALLKATGWEKRGSGVNLGSGNIVTLWSWGSK